MKRAMRRDFWAAMLAECASNRQRARVVAEWTRVEAWPAGLGEVGAARRRAAGLTLGARRVSGTPWTRDAVRQQRARAIGRARDLLYVLRQARRAGVLRVRVPS